jgi:two-component system sensor histidine kinase BaeS
MVAVAIGVLAFTAIATLAIARKAETDNARKELQSKAQQIARALNEYVGVRSASALNGTKQAGEVVRNILRVSNASVVTVTPGGAVEDGFGGGATGPVLRLPQGLHPSDLDVAALTARRQQTGQRGRSLFIAYPLNHRNNGTPVVVATKRVDRPLAPGAGAFYILVAAAATLIATIVAFLLARRVTGPIGEMRRTARRIAAGDLSARADVKRGSNDEMADLGRALNAMAAQLEHARGLERGFILSVSHDLRTPLTSIRGYAEALADGTLDDADGRKRAAEIIGGEARRLERLVADLLDLAHLDAHQFSLTPRPVDAGEVVEAAVLAFAPAAADLGIRLHVDARKPIPADADPERLGQVVANLVENALKYATSGIEIAVARADGDVVISVHDDGPGLSAADLPHVFDRLYASRTVPGRKVGTGLGLAIVRELSAAMGGSVWAEPSDRGARFVVRLPLPASVLPAAISSPG